MDDIQIIELYLKRDESAITHTDKKYGDDLRGISYRIIKNLQDSEECVNDTYIKVWSSVPPEKPLKFFAYLAKIVRNLTLNRYEMLTAKKRGSGEIPLVLEELSYCIPDKDETEREFDRNRLNKTIDSFLSSLEEEKAIIFVQRYFYLCSIKEIAYENKISQSKVKMMLLRLRSTLKEYLITEGIEV